MLGAFGTHALRERVSERDLAIWQTGVQYHTLHAVMLVVVGLLAAHDSRPQIARIGNLFVAGIVIFAGSLYGLVLTQQRWLGAITPIGGVFFIVAWGWLAVTMLKKPA